MIHAVKEPFDIGVDHGRHRAPEQAGHPMPVTPDARPDLAGSHRRPAGSRLRRSPPGSWPSPTGRACLGSWESPTVGRRSSFGMYTRRTGWGQYCPRFSQSTRRARCWGKSVAYASQVSPSTPAPICARPGNRRRETPPITNASDWRMWPSARAAPAQ